MKLIIKGWTFEGASGNPTPPQLVELLEYHYPSTDARAMPLMAALRNGAGTRLGQIPELCDKFKIPYEQV